MRRRWLSLSLVALSACASPRTARLDDRLVATLPSGIDAWWFTVSPGGSGAAYAERRGSEAFLHFRDRVYGPYS